MKAKKMQNAHKKCEKQTMGLKGIKPSLQKKHVTQKIHSL